MCSNSEDQDENDHTRIRYDQTSYSLSKVGVLNET